MSSKRILALLLRYTYASRDPSRITEFLFWPMIDVGYFGMIALWGGSLAHDPGLIRLFITALVLWQIIYRAHYEVCVNIMDEIQDRNLVNLASSPLKKSEWILAMMAAGLFKSIFTLSFGVFVGWLFFRVNVFSLGFSLLPFLALCLLSGWMIGLFAGGILIFKGMKLQQLPWVVIMLAALLSAVLYPIEILPNYLKFLTQSLPMSYIFQGMRALLTEGKVSSTYWIWGSSLSIFYLALAIKFFLYMFEKSLNRGLSRLT